MAVMSIDNERQRAWGAMNIANTVATSGYVFLPAFRPEVSTSQIAAECGDLAAIEEGRAVHSLTPKISTNATPNSYSGIFGLNIFPLHTDFAHWRWPPRYLMLRCRKGYQDVVTVVLDGNIAVQKIGDLVLGRALVKPRRPVGGAISIIRLREDIGDGKFLLRWDETFIRPASKAGQTGFDAMKQVLKSVTGFKLVLANPGDLLIVDNWRMLHSRSSVPADRVDREIERAYLSSLR